MKKRWIILIAAALLLCGGCWAMTLLTDTESRLEQRLGVTFPAGINLTCEDSHGGFFGDGQLIAQGEFSSQETLETFVEQLEGRWNPLPVEDDILQAILTQLPIPAERLSDLPAVTQGYWFYLDRYQAKYGEKCSFNPILQNCTFALLDTQSGQLYIVENDC